MTEDDMQFKGTDPGAVKHGNFINYYEFNPANRRLKLLPERIWEKTPNKLICLDIGCNAGDLTQGLYEYIKNNYPLTEIYILGIDIDPMLISRAEENNDNKNITFWNLDFMNDLQREDMKKYLSQFNQDRFDVIFSFSLTMWIHLNHGDEGLERFLKICCQMTEYFILEPQPWKCYKTAVRRMKRSASYNFPLFNKLKIRENIEDFINTEIQACKFQISVVSGRTEWGREICIYKNYST